MTNNPKLNDLQLVLLSTAAQRIDGNVFPVANSITKEEERIRKAVQSLLKRSLVEEGPVKDCRIAWRKQVDQPVGVFITVAGRSLIEPTENAAECVPKAKKGNPDAVRKGSKSELVIGLLRSPDGATLNELVTATGWLPHTTRAALTGLRKNGHVVEKTKRDGATCYRIAEVD